MWHFNQGRFRQQVSFLRRQFLQDGDLPFSNVLSEDVVCASADSDQRMLDRSGSIRHLCHAVGVSWVKF